MDTVVKWLQQQKTARVKLGFTDVDGVLRCKYLHRDKVLNALKTGLGFCNVTFGWDIQDTLYEAGSIDPGYADVEATIVTNSRRIIPWEDGVPFFLLDFRSSSSFSQLCPRSLLTRVLKQAADLGFTARFGTEFEWFVYQETPSSLAAKDYAQLQPLTPGMFGYSGLRTSQNSDFLQAIFEQTTEFGVSIEGLHTETGPGAIEVAIQHQEALNAADQAVLFKQATKEISYRYGFVSSFMAKPAADLPGCGGHLHQSLWQDGQNVFYDSGRPQGMSAILEHYLAGQLKLMPLLLPLFAPTVNSYKRYVTGSWAATHANWGVDNRTTALRYIPGGEKSTRLETRVPGADANPYLSIAAALAAGLYGIKQKMALPPAVNGSAYDQLQGTPLAKDLGKAIEIMQASSLPADLFGANFSQHFLSTRAWEWSRYQQSVTDWERRRYFELI